MKIATISDCHGQWARADYPAADVLVMAGDLLKNYSYDRTQDAFEQLVELVALRKHLESLLEAGRYKYVVICAGNHDFAFERINKEAVEALYGAPAEDCALQGGGKNGGIHYLQDREVQLMVDGSWRKFYGSPYTPWFHSWAFNLPNPDINMMRASMVAKTLWKMIPEGLDVLVTHGPPYGVLDACISGERVGCKHLKERLDRLGKAAPKVHVFGHIHHSFGQQELVGDNGNWMKAVNTAILGEDYTTMRPMPVVEV